MIAAVILTVAPGQLDAFRDFERRAAAIMARHGGAIERAIFVAGAGAGAGASAAAVADADAGAGAGADAAADREVHLVRFPDEAAFAAYRADPELAALAPLRARAIAATLVLAGDDVTPLYSTAIDTAAAPAAADSPAPPAPAAPAPPSPSPASSSP